MIAHPSSVVLTAHVAQWAEESADRLEWLLVCLGRHNAAGWGDLDPDDQAANARSLHEQEGRLLSRYPLPGVLDDDDRLDDAVWIITDDVADTDSVTTILWPNDY